MICQTFLIASALSVSAPAGTNDVRIDEPTREAIAKGLAYLADRQNADGSWSDGSYPHNTAITAFALLAFMSDGHLPNQGKYGPEVAKGARFLMASSRESDGYIFNSRDGRGGSRGGMYCHGMATLALTQLFGMTGDAEVKKVLERATKLIIRTQNREGGWRYNPEPSDADISATIMQVMALRGAKNSGLHVPKPTFDRALEYIDRCYHRQSGGYGYQPGGGPGFARTAAGVCVIKLVGEYDKDVSDSVKYLQANMKDRSHYFYGHYYASHALYQVGGEAWKKYYDDIKEKLLPEQNKSGEWSTGLDQNRVGPIYQTSIAVIILSVPSHYLPIFQR